MSATYFGGPFTPHVIESRHEIRAGDHQSTTPALAATIDTALPALAATVDTARSCCQHGNANAICSCCWRRRHMLLLPMPPLGPPDVCSCRRGRRPLQFLLQAVFNPSRSPPVSFSKFQTLDFFYCYCLGMASGSVSSLRATPRTLLKLVVKFHCLAIKQKTS